jgi:gas vesicle protein
MGNGYLIKKQVEGLKALYKEVLKDYKTSREELLDFADELQRAWDRLSTQVRQVVMELQEVIKHLEATSGYVRIVNRPEYQEAKAAKAAKASGQEPGPGADVPAGEPAPSEPQSAPEANQ